MQLCINVGCERTPTTAEKSNGFLKKKYKPIRLIVPLVNTLARFRFVSWKGLLTNCRKCGCNNVVNFWFLCVFLILHIDDIVNNILSYFSVKDTFK